jgi:hypothetical protein
VRRRLSLRRHVAMILWLSQKGIAEVLKERPYSTVGAKVEVAISSPSLNAWYGNAGLKIL